MSMKVNSGVKNATVKITGEDGGHVEVVWTCPQCGQSNVDWYDETAAPYCEQDTLLNPHELEWSDVLTAQQVEQANTLWKRLEKEAWIESFEEGEGETE